MRFCPYAQRVHLVLYAKNIPHDIVYIDLKKKPEWYVEKIASTKVPAIAVAGKDIYESLIICDYLDEKYPNRPLYKRDDPLQKALDRILIDKFAKLITHFYKLQLGATMELSTLEIVLAELDLFEKELGIRGTPYFSGAQPGMVDYMIWPWSERLDILRVLGGDEYKIPKERFPRVLQWSERMQGDVAVKQHSCTPEQYAKFLQSYKAGTPDYDIVN